MSNRPHVKFFIYLAMRCVLQLLMSGVIPTVGWGYTEGASPKGLREA